MVLSIEERDTLQILVKVSASIGFLGVIGMLYMYLKHPASFKNPTGRLILAITFCSLIDSITKFIGRYGTNSGLNSFACQAQGFILQQNSLSEWLLGLFITIYTLLIIVFEKNADAMKRWEIYIIGACVIMPLPLAISAVTLNPDGVNTLIGDADFWCWISTEHYALYQLYFAFIPLAIVICIETVAIAFILYSLHRTKKLIRLLPSESFQDFIAKRLLLYMAAFWVIWVPSLLNRSSTAITGQSSYALSVWQALSSPSQGMIQFLVFLYTWRNSALKRDVKVVRSEMIVKSTSLDTKFDVAHDTMCPRIDTKITHDSSFGLELGIDFEIVIRNSIDQDWLGLCLDSGPNFDEYQSSAHLSKFDRINDTGHGHPSRKDKFDNTVVLAILP